MARSRKEDDKCPWWSWVPSCNPLEVSDDNVKTAYRINIARCENKAHNRNCRGNPFCLSKLGEDKWSKNQKELNSDHLDDPEKERRKPGTYVGLKNLGATCYVNSLLQLWFHNLNFRKAIFMWNDSQDTIEDPDERHNTTIQEKKLVLKNLQAVFALMQSGNKRFVDPTDFITSLRLDISVQQDAQEFSKLFLSKLETFLSSESQKEVRDLIKDNFCGEYLYVTRCTKCLMESKCPSKFYELNLNVKGNKTIQDCLKEFMKKEILDGDNKYSCAVCQEKQDAERFISVTELPPVLNLQLMRFYYDINTDQKRKLNTAIQFTEKLNMSELCPDAKEGLEYTLSAVLYHGGNSANSGHYVAHICDSESGTWYKFNDESVEKIDNKKLKFTIEDEYEDAKKNKGQRALPKGWYQSKSAYMLVYTRSDQFCSDQEKEADNNALKLPQHLENFVSQQNAVFENWIAETKISNDDTVKGTLTQQDEMIYAITMMPVDSDSEDFDAVPTSWLQQWLLKPEIDSIVDNRKFICQHGKLDPNEVPNVKYINSEIAENLFERYRGGPRLRYCEFKCKSCVMNKCFEMRMKSRISEEKKFITNKMKSIKEIENGFWVGKSSIRNWHNLAQKNLDNLILDENCLKLLNDVNTEIQSEVEMDTKEEYTKSSTHEAEAVILQNGLDDVSSSSQFNNCSKMSSCVRVTCSNSTADVQSVPMDLDPVVSEAEPLTTKSSASFNEVFQNFALGHYSSVEATSSTENGEASEEDKMNGVTESMPNNCHNKCDISAVTSTTNQASLNTLDSKPSGYNANETVDTNVKNEFWNKPVKRKHDDDESSNTESLFNEDLLCPHGNLSIEENKRRLVPEVVYRIFKKYFPFAKEFTVATQPCGECKSIASEDEVAKDMYKTEAMNQKERLPELYLDRNRPLFKSDKIDRGNIYYVVNKEFISSWRKFIREAGKKEPPYSIKNFTLLCSAHGGLLYDLNNGVPETIVCATSTEWERLCSWYSPDHVITVKCLENGEVETSPVVCTPCMNERIEAELKAKLCYTNAKIYIKLLNEEREELQLNSTAASSADESNPSKRAKINHNNCNNNINNNNNNNINECNSSNGNENVHSFSKDANINYNNDSNNNNDSSSKNDTDFSDIKCNLMNGTSTNHNQFVNDNSTSSVGNCNNGYDDTGYSSPKNCNNIDHSNTNHVSSSGDGITTNEPDSSRIVLSDVQDENNGAESSHKISNGEVNGKSSPSHLTNGPSTDYVPVRRSNRPRRGNKTLEIIVSSDLTLKDVKKKIYEKMEVVTLDQHLITDEGVELAKDDLTLADLSIFPGTLLHLKVDEPPRELSPEWQESTTSREVERGFSGTVLA